MIAVPNRKHSSIRAKRNYVTRLERLAQRLPALHIPDVNGTVAVCRCQKLSSAAEGQAVQHGANVVYQTFAEALTARNIPELDSVIVAGYGQEFSIRAKGRVVS